MHGWNARKNHAQPAQVVMDDFDFDRFNDVVWLECVASNPHMHSPTTSTIARVALELNKRIGAGNSPVIPDGYVMVPKEPTQAMCAAFNDSDYGRKSLRERYVAMLAAAPHDTPALNSLQSIDSVADRWIPVSERMPDVGVKVLCFPVKDEPIHATFNGQLWLQDVSWSGSDDPIDNVIPVSVTHWMPLPAAPQEVSHG
ncbi:hypothetical protein CWS54_14635 [Klebsiella michiganensis]|nr:hypothetical protein [Klebsiella michiganensis]